LDPVAPGVPAAFLLLVLVLVELNFVVPRTATVAKFASKLKAKQGRIEVDHGLQSSYCVMAATRST